MYICLEAWGLQFQLKVRSRVCVCVCVCSCSCVWLGGRKGEALESLFQPCLSCEMKAEGFAHLIAWHPAK